MEQLIHFEPPANLVLDVGVTPAGRPRPDGVEGCNTNAITPETERSTHYFWAQAHNFMVDDPKMTELVFEQVKTAFDQDVTAIEAQQRNIDLGPAAPRVDVNGDAGQIHAIRLLRRRIAEEREAAGRLVA